MNEVNVLKKKIVAQPKVRFLKFSEEWREYKSKDVFKSVSDKNHPNLPVLSASQKKGMIYRSDGNIDIQYNKNNTKTYKRVTAGQFVIHLRSFQGGFAYSEIEGITSPAYTVIDLKYKEDHNPMFWKQILTSKAFIKKLETITYGIRDGRSISFTEFSTLKFKIPSNDEQQNISELFKIIDNTIELQQRLLNDHKQLKKAMLQKMFPQKGESVPRIRFAEFTDNWGQTKLGSLGDIVTGSTPPTMNKKNYGNEYLFVSPADIKENRYIDNTITKLSKQGFKTGRYIRKGASLFVSIGSTIGKAAQANSELVTNQQINTIIPDSHHDDNFTFSLLIKEATQIRRLSSTQAVPIINKSTFSNIKIKIPKLFEQKKVGNFFKQLDETIALHEQKLETYQELKKAMLQKMFV